MYSPPIYAVCTVVVAKLAPGYKSCEVSPDDANDCSSQRHDQEGRESLQDIRHLYVALAYFHVSLEHVIQHLEYE